MNQNNEEKFDGRVWKYDVVGRTWSVLSEVNEVGGSRSGENVEAKRHRARGELKMSDFPEVSELGPSSHYLGGAVLLGWEGGRRMERRDGMLFGELPEPQIVHYGGDGGKTRNRYSNDLRSLRLRKTAMVDGDEGLIAQMEADCAWRTLGAADRLWSAACGAGGSVGSDTACTVEEILIRAYCLGEWQTINSL